MLPRTRLRRETGADPGVNGQRRELAGSCRSMGKRRLLSSMSSYPKSPKEMTKGMLYFPRMLDKIRLHAGGELHKDYHKNLGAMRAADGACCNFLRIHHRDLTERVKQGGSDEEILEWCFEQGRRLNEGGIG